MASEVTNNDNVILTFLQRVKDAHNGLPLTQNETLRLPNNASLIMSLNDFIIRYPSLTSEISDFLILTPTYHYKENKISYDIIIFLLFTNNTYNIKLKQTNAKKCLRESRLSLIDLITFINNFPSLETDFLTSVVYIRKKDEQDYLKQLSTRFRQKPATVFAIQYLEKNFFDLWPIFINSIYATYILEEYNQMKDKSELFIQLKEVISKLGIDDFMDALSDTKKIMNKSLRNFLKSMFKLNNRE